MRRFLLVVLALSSVVAAAGQTTSAPVLSASLRSHLEAEQFQVVSSVRGYPLGVRDKLQELFGGGMLDLANPGEPLLTRRLVAGGCTTDNHCIVYYDKAGATPTHRAALFHWSPSETKFEFGGAAPAGLKTVDDVRKAMLSGAVKGTSGPW